MSAISTILTRLRAAIWAKDVRDDIANAIEQCYSDVSNPTLKTEALEAALQNKIDQGKMAALTIGDHTITAEKLAQGVIDNTLATSGAAADAKTVGDKLAEINEYLGDVKADLDAIVPGLSDAAKEALLACFEHVAWVDGHGQDYYDVLAAALNQDSTIRFVMVNNSAYGPVNSTQGDKYYVPSTASASARFNPVKNKNNVIAVTDSDKYNLASYEVTNDTLIAFEAWTSTELVTREGYYAYNQEANPSWAQAAVVEAPYFACSFKKMNGTDFTTDEIDNAEGTIFVIGNSSDIVKWNGMDTGGITQKWIDKDQIIGITNPKKYALVSGYGVTGYHESNGGKVQISAKRATSLSQVIVGGFDGKTIGLSNYTLSTGAQIAYGIWYGYINPNNNSYNGTNYISDGTDNVYVFGKWNTENIILPVDSAKVGKRVILLAFKITNADREFTQAELREIPTLIQIS